MPSSHKRLTGREHALAEDDHLYGSFHRDAAFLYKMKALTSILLCRLWMEYAFAANRPSSNTRTAWTNTILRGIRDSKAATPPSMRDLSIVHTCMYDAWAAYDERANGTQLSSALRRPSSERTQASKEKAISHAAYRALADLLPANTGSVSTSS